MDIKKLTQKFYDTNSHLKEVLDNSDGTWVEGKARGYGVVIIEYNDLKFAIPLRSIIKHDASYITVRSKEVNVLGKGLDFSKAVLIDDPSYVSDQPFKISSIEYKKIKNKQLYIVRKFTKYVVRYKLAVIKNDKNVLNSPEYRFTTLINYHSYLN